MAIWKGARYYRAKDHAWVDRVDKDKRKNRAVHRLAKKARGPFTRLETTTKMTRPFSGRIR